MFTRLIAAVLRAQMRISPLFGWRRSSIFLYALMREALACANTSSTFLCSIICAFHTVGESRDRISSTICMNTSSIRCGFITRITCCLTNPGTAPRFIPRHCSITAIPRGARLEKSVKVRYFFSDQWVLSYLFFCRHLSYGSPRAIPTFATSTMRNRALPCIMLCVCISSLFESHRLDHRANMLQDAEANGAPIWTSVVCDNSATLRLTTEKIAVQRV
jgi:hypothetical protein